MHVDMHSEIARARQQEAINRAERYRLTQMVKREAHHHESPRNTLRTTLHNKALRWAALSSLVAAGSLLVFIN